MYENSLLPGRVIQGRFSGPLPALSRDRSWTTPLPSPTVKRPGLIVPRQSVQPQRTLLVVSQRGFAYQLNDQLLGLERNSNHLLPAPVQAKMEDLFTTDFSTVRVQESRAVSALGAQAFTCGSSLYFAPGHYQPSSPIGQRLIAHELTHVVQQKTGRVRNPFGQGTALVQDPGLEEEADRMSAKVAAFVVQPEMQPAAPTDGQRSRHGFPTRDIRRLYRKTGGKEKDIFMLEQGKAAAVSKTGDLRRVQKEVGTLKRLADHNIPSIKTSDVMMFQMAHRESPGFIVDWIPNTVDSNANPTGFQAALQRLRPEHRSHAQRDLDKIEAFIHRNGGILDLQVLLDSQGSLRVLDPRGDTEDRHECSHLIQRWRTMLDS